MTRPRWHDAVIIVAIVLLGLVGAWALWWDDVRDHFQLGPGSGSQTLPAPPTNGQT